MQSTLVRGCSYHAQALSDLCYRHIETVIREEDEEYELNPQLALHCVDSISKLCPPENVPNVVQCLKDNFLASKLTKEPACSHVSKCS